NPLRLQDSMLERMLSVAPQHRFPPAKIQLTESAAPRVLHGVDQLLPGKIGTIGVRDLTAAASEVAAICQRYTVDKRIWMP
ncbi:MAG TPA: hypothetical protein VJ124_12930, partial [Pyrinomonadaceae bacterium]|nr:hypothetical protein [Pyrinomonadaceae bacterium]